MYILIYKSTKKSRDKRWVANYEDSSFAGTKTKPGRVLLTHKKGDFGAISATKLRCADLESAASHIG